MYPFSNRWPSYSPSNGSTSSSGKSSSPIGTSVGTVKTNSTSHVTTSSSHSGLGLTWWHPPSFSGSDMHHFSSPPWSSHEHLEPLNVSRESSGPVFQSSHSRNGPPYHPSGHHSHSHSHHSHTHSFHHSRSNHLHSGGTLIHFPHSSSHQSLSGKDGSSKSSSIDQSLSPSQRDISEKKPGSTLPADSHEREKSWDDLTKLHSHRDTFSPHMRVERPAKYNRYSEGISDEEAIGTKSPSDEKRYEEKDRVERANDERSHFRHISHCDDRGHESIHSGRSEHRHGHDSPLVSHPGNPSYISSVSERALASAKASYLNKDTNERGGGGYAMHSREDRHHSPFSFNSPREKDIGHGKSSLLSPDSHALELGFDQARDLQVMPHDHHRDHASYRESGTSGLEDETMDKAEATREWVNKQPALHISPNYNHYMKQEKRFKNSDPSPLNRTSDSPKAAKVGKHDRGGGNSEKAVSNKDQHYESPLNSSLPRYTGGSHAVKSETERSELYMHKRGRNPFNVDFLSVSSDADGQSRKETDRHYHIPSSDISSLDRVSVIKSSLTMPAFSRDTARSKKVLETARNETSQFQSREHRDAASLNRPTSLVDSPLAPKLVPPISGKPRSLIKPDDLSPKNSDTDSSSDDDSGDQIEERRHGTGKQINEKDWDIERDGTENDGT